MKRVTKKPGTLKYRKRIMAWLMALCMVAAMTPVNVSAAESEQETVVTEPGQEEQATGNTESGQEEQASTSEDGLSVQVGDLTISPTDGAALVEGTDYSYKSFSLSSKNYQELKILSSKKIRISGTATDYFITVVSNVEANIILDGVYIKYENFYGKIPVTEYPGIVVIKESAMLNLELRNDNSLVSSAKLTRKNGASMESYGCCAISVSSSSELIIRGDGKLTANASYGSAGIGACVNKDSGKITINSGIIEATAGMKPTQSNIGASGIGKGAGTSTRISGDITINGGTITATGIGVGTSDTAGKITINGGNINSTISDTELQNSAGENLYLTTITMKDVTEPCKINSIPDIGEYNVEGMTTIGGKLYLWLPVGKTIMTIDTDQGQFTSWVTTTESAAEAEFAKTSIRKCGDFTIETSGEEGTDYSYSDHLLTIKSSRPIRISGTTTQDRIVVEGGTDQARKTANVTLDGLSISWSSQEMEQHVFYISDYANLNLSLCNDNVLKSSSFLCAALIVMREAELVIDGEGSLTAESGRACAGIGNIAYVCAGKITINGGTITGIASYLGPGIGSGYVAEDAAGAIIINGGTITAQGACEEGETAIGGDKIIINGGNINASCPSGNLFATAPKNSEGKKVYLTKISLGNVTESCAVNRIICSDGYEYGVDGLRAMSGVLNLYLPADITVKAIYTDLGIYVGEATATISGAESTFTRAFSVGDFVLGRSDGSEPDSSDYSYSNNVLTITSEEELLIQGCTDTDRIAVKEGIAANVVLSGLEMTGNTPDTALFDIPDGSSVNLVLKDNNKIETPDGSHTCAVRVSSGGQLTISGTGSLSAVSGTGAAGIGGGYGGNAGKIIINGGTITATGGTDAPGIGSDNIVINGGNINATTKTTPVNSDGTMLSLAKVSLEGIAGSCRIKRIIEADSYGIKGMTTLDGLLYLYLPEGTEVKHIDTESGLFLGSVIAGSEETGSFTKVGVKCGDLVINPTDDIVPVEGTDYSYSDNVLTIKSSKEIRISGTTAIDRISVDKDVEANVILDELKATASTSGHVIDVASGTNTKLNLELRNDNELIQTRSGYGGLIMEGNSELIIDGNGSLISQSAENCAGIGGGLGQNIKGITINGGTITTIGGYKGIGHGQSGSSGKITINGGNINTISFGSQPVNSSGAKVYLTKIVLFGVEDSCMINSITGIENYDIDNIKAIDGALYLYLPAGKKITSIETDLGIFKGAVTSKSSATETVFTTDDLSDISLTADDGSELTEKDYSYADYTLTILSDKDITISGTSNKKVVVADGVKANITLDNFTADVNGEDNVSAFAIKDGASANITLAGSNVLKSGANCAGMSLAEDATVTITGSGNLQAMAGSKGAGIGGDNNKPGGNVIIDGANVYAVAGSGAQKIGHGAGNNVSGIIKNSSGDDVYCITITVPTDSNNQSVGSILGAKEYENKSLQMLGKKAYLWIPLDTTITELKINDVYYIGKATPNINNTANASFKLLVYLDEGSVIIRETTFEQNGVSSGYDGNIMIAQRGTEATTNTITVTGFKKRYITLAGVHIDVSGINGGCPLNLNGTSSRGNYPIHLCLADDTVNILKAGKNSPGIYTTSYSDNGTVTVYYGTLEIDGGGILDVTGGESWPGIGSATNGYSKDFKDANGNTYTNYYYKDHIIINGGTIIAKGGSNAAGIGGSWNFRGPDVKINGGNVYAVGKDNADNIGFGNGVATSKRSPVSTITLAGIGSAGYQKVTSTDGANGYYNNTYTINGKLYLWEEGKPSGYSGTITEVVSNGNKYTGSVAFPGDSNVVFVDNTMEVESNPVLNLDDGNIILTNYESNLYYNQDTRAGRYEGIITIKQGSKSATTNTITVESGVHHMVLAGVNIDVSGTNQATALDLSNAGACMITLKEGTKNILKSGNDRPGIYVPANNLITFDGTGRLEATGGASWPGIGRNGNGNIHISSGTIIAAGGSNAAGIGGSWGQNGGTVKIDGGNILAAHGENATNNIGAGRFDDNSGTCTLINKDSHNIYLTEIMLLGTGKNQPVTSITGIGDYNIEGLTVADGKLAMYLPEGTTITEIQCGDVTYTGSVTTTSDHQATAVFTSGECMKNPVVFLDYGSIILSDTNGTLYYKFGETGSCYAYSGNITITQSGSNATSNNIVVESGTHNITIMDINIKASNENAIMLKSGSNLNLTLSGDNYLEPASERAGILVPENTSLTIDGAGSLDVRNGNKGAAIGCNQGGKVGSIAIHGGKIIAHSEGYGGAGIGNGGWNSSGGTIYIDGGYIIASANAGDEGSMTASTITIKGGIIEVRDNKLDNVNKTNCVFGKNGEFTVYGDAKVSVDFELASDEKLTVPNNTTLTIDENVTMTNNAEISVKGNMVNNGRLTGTGTITPGLSLTVTGNDKQTEYTESYDVSQIFTIPDYAGKVSYKILDEDTSGQGTVSGDTLTITKSGIFNIQVSVAASNFYAAATQTAKLTVMPQKYNVLLTSRVTKGDNTTVATLEGGGTYYCGEQVSVKAPELEGFRFRGWYAVDESETGYSGDALSSKLAYSFTLDSETSLVAVYEANAGVTLSITGTHFTVNGGAEQATGNYTQSFTAGTRITLNATGENFAYWMNASNKVVSTSATYEFTLVGNTTYTPVYKNVANNTIFVEFVSAYGQILQAQTYNTNDTITFPVGPSKIGYTFTGWDKTADDIKKAITLGVTYMKVSPVYVQKEASYTVTIHFDGNDELKETHTGQKDGSSMTVTAKEISGKKFSHWSSDAAGTKVLGTSDSYFFTVSSDMEIYANYVAEDAVVEQKPVINVTDKYAFEEDGIKRVGFVVNRDVPDRYTVEETGVLFGTNAKFAGENADSELVIGGSNLKQVVSSSTDRSGVYVLTVNVGSSVDKTIYVRGYIMVKDTETGNIETVYSVISGASYSSLNNKGSDGNE